jgi:hypothetical protein
VQRIAAFALLAVLFSGACANAQEQSRGPSTPQERAREVAITRKLEAAPLDQSLNPDAQWAITWLIQVPDIDIKLCTSAMGDFLNSKYKYAPRITAQFTLASAAFIIEHPNKKDDRVAQYVAGVESALKAYQAILKSEPDAKSKALDQLLQKQSDQKLEDFVRSQAAKDCKS